MKRLIIDARRAVYSVLLGWIFDAFDAFLITILIIDIANELGFGKIGMGIVIGLTLAGSGIGGFFFGILADKIGRKKSLTLSIFTYSFFTLLTGFVRNLWELMIVRLLTGFGVGGEWATGMTLVTEFSPPDIRGKIVGIIQLGWPIGVILAAIDARFIAPLLGWRGAFYIAALPGIIIALVVLLVVSESPYWHKKLAKIRRRQTKELLKLLFVKYKREVVLALLLDICAMFSYWLFWSFYVNYLREQVGIELIKSMEYLILSQMGAALGYLLYGYIQDAIGRRKAWIVFINMYGIFIIAYSFLTHDPVLLLIFAFPLGFSTGFWSGFGAILSEIFPTEVRATGTGFCFNMGRTINIVSPIIVAYLATVFPDVGWAAIGIASITAFLTNAIIWRLPETRGKILE